MCFEWLVKWDWENFIPAASPGDSPLAHRWYEPFSIFSTFTLPRSLFPSTRLMERRRNKWRAVAQQGMQRWKCRGRGTRGGGLGYRAYLFSGMRQVCYPQLRLAHLFMLNATPWEARSCHRKYRNPFFSLSAAPTDCWIRFIHLSNLYWDPHIRCSQQIIGFAFHLAFAYLVT